MKYRYRESHEMKDSGVEWLGMIPKEWEVKQFKFLVNSIKNGTTETQVDNGELNVSRIETISNGEINFEKVGKINKFRGYENYRLNKGDFLLSHINSLKMVGNIALYIDNNPLYHGMNLLRIEPSFDYKYLYHIMKSKYFRNSCESIAKPAINQASISTQNLKSIQIPVTLKEATQQKIADFLDKKCEEFDSVIAKKEMLINKLEEAKKSLISEVVTGKVKVIEKENGEYGIIKREAHEMKDSGVEWLGMIPKEWEVNRVRHLILEALMYGANESAELDDRNLPRYIRITDFGFDGKLKEDTFKSLEYEKAKNYLLKENDILFARSGGTVGKTFIFKGYNKEACFAGYLIKARFNSKKINPEFAYYFTKTNNYENWKNSIFSQATIQNIGADKYNELKISYCELDKQNQIIGFLDEKSSQFDIAIEKQKESIEKLKSAKQSLISEAVTGKIEVL